MVWKRLVLLPFVLALLGTTKPAVDPRTISDAWPPARYTTATAVRVIFATSQAQIDQLCGKADPKDGNKGGCTGHDPFGAVIVMPHPALVSAPIFQLIADHELAHANGVAGDSRQVRVRSRPKPAPPSATRPAGLRRASGSAARVHSRTCRARCR